MSLQYMHLCQNVLELSICQVLPRLDRYIHGLNTALCLCFYHSNHIVVCLPKLAMFHDAFLQGNPASLQRQFLFF